MKRDLFVLILTLIIIAISNVAFAADVVKIGIAEPMTGAMATCGYLAMPAYELAREQKPTVLGKEVELVLVDNKSDKVEAASAVSRLIEQEGVVAILGGCSSSLVIAGGEVANIAGIPFITPNASHPLVTHGKEYVFRICFVDTFLGKVLAEYAYEDLGIRKSALLIDIAQDYSVGLAKFFKDTFTELGGEIVSETKYNTGDQDFTAQISDIINSGAEALFFPSFFGDAALIALQSRELGFKGQFLGGDTLHYPIMIEIGGEAVEGLIAGSSFAEDMPTNPAMEKFAELFRKKYNNPPNLIAIFCYDAYNLLLDAIERAGSLDPVAIRDALAATKDFPGASGATTIDENHDAIKSAVLVKVVNGKFVYQRTFIP